jgi:hypothetical protein
VLVVLVIVVVEVVVVLLAVRVAVVDVVGVVVVEVVLVVVVALRQSRGASWASLFASWLRLSRSVALTLLGRPATRLLKVSTLLLAARQSPELTAEPTLSRAELRLFA